MTTSLRADPPMGGSRAAPAELPAAPRGARETLAGIEIVRAADLLVSPTDARRACKESGRTLALLDDYSHFFAELLPADCDFSTWTWPQPRIIPSHQYVGQQKRSPRVHGYRTPKGAFRAVRRLLKDCHVKTPSLLAAERLAGQEVVHVHGLVRRLDGSDRNAVWVTSVKRFGSFRLLPANPAAVPYVCKYLFKAESCGRHEWLDLSGVYRDDPYA